MRFAVPSAFAIAAVVAVILHAIYLPSSRVNAAARTQDWGVSDAGLPLTALTSGNRESSASFHFPSSI